MEQIKLTSNEFIYYGALAGGVLGLLLGIIVLILGFVRKERSYGVFGFLGSVILGPISGILSVVVAAIFLWLILRKPKKETISNSVDSTDSESSDSDAYASKNSDSDVS